MSFWSPTSLNQMVGNGSSLELLRAILSHRDRAPQAYMFEGPHGVGKSTMARLFLQQLTPDQKVVTIQPERFSQTLQQEDLAEYPCMIWEHVDRLNSAQGDQLCAHLDRSDLQTFFCFTSSEHFKVPQGVRARTLRIPCVKPAVSDLVGLLAAVCSAHGFNYEHNALTLLALRSQSIPSRAIIALQAASLLGPICNATINLLPPSVEEQADRLLHHILENDSPMSVVAEMKDSVTTDVLVDALFAAYAQAYFDESRLSKLASPSRAAEIFIKWKGQTSLPASSLFILVKELLEADRPVLIPIPLAEPGPKKAPLRPTVPAILDSISEGAVITGDIIL